jgi:hypothetical protein
MTGRHRDFLPILLGVFALVTVMGVINDEAIAAISPRHFAIFYPLQFPVQAPWAQALCFSLVAVGGSGLTWGSLLYWVGHYGPGPLVRPRATLTGAAVVLFITIVAAWGLGWRAWATGTAPYKDFFYPSTDPRLVFSQTVQLTNEVVGVAGAGFWLAAIALWRWWRTDQATNHS